MKILSKRALREFWQNDQNAENPLRYWYSIADKASWNSFPDVRNSFNTADQVCECVVFDVGGNKYRVITKIDYKYKTIFIIFVLTHADYSKGRWKRGCKCKKTQR